MLPEHHMTSNHKISFKQTGKISIIVMSVVINPSIEKIIILKSNKLRPFYTIPGGKVSVGESILDALKREIYEETRLKVAVIEQLFPIESVFSGLDSLRHLIFLPFVSVTDDLEVIINEESSDFKWVDIDEISNFNMCDISKNIINKVIEGGIADDIKRAQL